jgi:hypothetical protein
LAAFGLSLAADEPVKPQAASAPASRPAVAAASQPAAGQSRPQRYTRPTLPTLPGLATLPTPPTLPRPLTYRTARAPYPYQPTHPDNFAPQIVGPTVPARPPRFAAGAAPLLQVPYRNQPSAIVSRPVVGPESMYYRSPTIDLLTPSLQLSARARQMANAAGGNSAYLSQGNRGYYTGFQNARGGTDYLNTRTGRLYLGVDNRNGVQYSINPRSGAQVFSYQNANGTTDYFNPRTGRWSFAVPDFAR